MTFWRFIDSGPCDASYNMALDESIAASVRKGDSPPTLRLYGWRQPAVSLGAFQKTGDIDISYCTANNVQVVRRPTGGRGILHGDELTYSFSAKNEGLFAQGLLASYRHISGAFSLALARLGLPVKVAIQRENGRDLARSPLCFQSISYGEITINGKKLVGSAQKRWSNGFLQQGSIPYKIDFAVLAAVFRNKGQKTKGEEEDFAGLKAIIHDFDTGEFTKHLKESFEILFGISFLEALPSDQELEQAKLLRFEKYQQPL